MKKIVFSFLVFLMTASAIKAQETEQKTESGKIYFLRSTGFAGSAQNNKKYSIHEVPAGKHSCSVQFGGKKSKEGAEKFEVLVEPGKITYVQIVFETGMWINNVYCEEVTENTAKQKMINMSEDTDCQ
jgi:hypothetical protein